MSFSGHLTKQLILACNRTLHLVRTTIPPPPNRSFFNAKEGLFYCKPPRASYPLIDSYLIQKDLLSSAVHRTLLAS